MLRIPSAVLRWGLSYEAVYIAVTLLTGLAFFKSPALQSLPFIKEHNALYSVLYIWLNNVASFFLGASFVVLSPLTGLFASAYLASSGGQIIASFLSGKCPLSHLIYGLFLEDQAYVLLWSFTTKIYYTQKECQDLVCRWNRTSKLVKKIALYAFLIFLVLAIIEVMEVKAFA